MRKTRKNFQAQFDDFFDWMKKGGMLDRWSRQKEVDGVKKNRRKLNKKIREAKSITASLT